MNKKIIYLVLNMFVIFGCSNVFDPEIENIRGLEDSYNDPNFAQGIIINGYARIPTNGWSFSELATDDAVSNNTSNSYSRIATGQWASNFNPLDQWTNSKAAIQYLNLFLEVADQVNYASVEAADEMFRDRNKGEAYGLRALFMYYLLRAHGGKVNEQLLGVPIVNEPETVSTDFNQPRPTFNSCLQQLFDDLDKALELLPYEYNNISDESMIPSKYADLNPTTGDFNRAFGDDAKQLFSGKIALAIKAQVALMASSPAFSSGTDISWEDAASYAGDLLELNNGLAGIDPNGLMWYSDAASIDNIGGGNNPNEILWRASIGGASSNLESDNFPPTLYGNGLVNPTQNFVDAFPMSNGYPISHASSGYDSNNPYEGRDPRLDAFVLYNEGVAGVDNTTVYTSIDGGTNDGLNITESSTRTGYYLKKLLRQDVNLNPVSVNGQRHLQPRIRFTEIYLIYAEAANEAWGPNGTGGYSFSAYDVIKAIRQRAGIASEDLYLESIKNDKSAMRTLIQNERRLELSFEGFRFWDLRRWDKDLTETAKGVSIDNDNHTEINVENRLYESHMIYGPIPNSETLKFNEIQQNDGW